MIWAIGTLLRGCAEGLIIRRRHEYSVRAARLVTGTGSAFASNSLGPSSLAVGD